MTTRTLPWKPPPAVDVEALPVGKWWDAVKAPAAIGERALKTLGDETGAVIQDKRGTLYWLVEVGSVERNWQLRGVRLLAELADERTYLGVPPVSWTTGPRSHWRVPLGPDHYLTHPWRLRQALAEADRAEYGLMPEGRQLCYRCQLPTDEPIPVDVETGANGVGQITYACPTHAPLYRTGQQPRTLTSAPATEHEARR
ncbi:hypothetical protein ACH4VS_30180 [Streptomyces hygroscopicus]|uniref:hypothetical protein n=1 Tax=Streptomyces hygroscopicus TaxID=1912 RepID=UPI00083021FA|nr:hypothetical protein [Streptomyces hygroscopicus]GLV80291.1 hypothetical protein Shyhy02_82910 [Streptomyces hygroscopicus subsp. hygroscopicus]